MSNLNYMSIDEISQGDIELKQLLNKVTLLGLDIKTYDTKCRHEYYVISISSDNHIIYIPNNVKMIELPLGSDGIYIEPIRKLRGTVKVQGGKGLIALDNLFSRCNIDVLDLRKLNLTREVTAGSIFQNSKINTILFGKEIEVTELDRAFENGIFGELNLNNIKVNQVKNLDWIFSDAKVKTITFDEWYLESLKCAVYAFSGLEIETLDLRLWNLKEVGLKTGLFKYSKIKNLILTKEDREHLISIGEQLGF